MPIITGSGANMATVTAAQMRHWLADKLGDNVLGTPTAGAAGSLTDANRRREDANFWDGADLHLYAGTGAGQSRQVSSSSAAGVLSVVANWTSTPDTTSLYELHQLFLTEQYDRFITAEMTELMRQRLLLNWKFDTSLTWTTDQFDYTVPTGFVAIQLIEVQNVTGTPGSDDYEPIPNERWYIRHDSTRKIVFNTRFGQFTSGYAFRVSGFAEFTVPAADTDTFNFDPDPIICGAYVRALEARLSHGGGGDLQVLLREARADRDLARNRMSRIDFGAARVVEPL